MNRSRMALSFVLLLILAISGCERVGKDTRNFVALGIFYIKHNSDGTVEVKDGIGRSFKLIPRDRLFQRESNRGDYHTIPIPVKRIVAYSTLDVAYLRALGVLDALVGVTKKKDEWIIPQVRKGMETGRIAYVGEPHSIDFERIVSQKPELVLTWDPSIVPVMDKLKIPCVVTTSGTALDLESRIQFVEFLSVFFGKEEEAAGIVNRIKSRIKEIKLRTSKVSHRPKVIWGDVYAKRVLVEPGNSWVAHLVKLAGGEYLFDDIRGAS